MSEDPYRVLGVGKDATDAEVKRSYRKLARQHHPDRNPGDAAAEERFKAIQAAYDQIGTAAARKEYDQQQRCLLYTSPSPRDQRGSRMPSSA